LQLNCFIALTDAFAQTFNIEYFDFSARVLNHSSFLQSARHSGYPATGYRQLDARTAFFYYVTGITPAMAMRVTGIGSHYLLNMLFADKNYYDGSKTYKVTLPEGIPEANFWSHGLRQPDTFYA
jgi:hypothetical protein